MEEKDQELKPPTMNNLKGKISKLSIGDINLDEIERHPTTLYVTPRGPAAAAAAGNTMTSSKPSSSGARWNCLCSPTTHEGSFRCRYHRLAGMTRGGSVGSNLSLLGNSKSEPISDSLQAQ